MVDAGFAAGVNYETGVTSGWTTTSSCGGPTILGVGGQTVVTSSYATTIQRSESIVAGQNYTFSVDLNRANVTMLDVELWTSNSTTPGTGTLLTSWSNPASGQLTYAFTAPTGTSYLRMVFKKTSTEVAAYALDNIRLNTLASQYTAVVVVKADYYPFGMTMEERYDAVTDYRYAYNGMEVDPEMKGNGNSYTTEFRQYDPRLGRWLSLDPLMMEFPWMSPYVGFDDNPIVFVDPYGMEATGGGNPAIYNKEEEEVGGKPKLDPGLPKNGYATLKWVGSTATGAWGKTASGAMNSSPKTKYALQKVMSLAKVREQYAKDNWDYEHAKGTLNVQMEQVSEEGLLAFSLSMRYRTSKGKKVTIILPLYAYRDGYEDQYGKHEATIEKIDLKALKNQYTNCFADAFGLVGILTSPNKILRDDYKKKESSDLKVGDVGLYEDVYDYTDKKTGEIKEGREPIHMIRIIGEENGEFIYRSNWLNGEIVEGNWARLLEQFEIYGLKNNLTPENFIWYEKK